MALTKRQKEFLDFLAGFLEKNGYCPSYEEIADGLSLASLATVHKHILALETKHYLKRGFNQSRSLEIATKYYDEQRQHRHAAARMTRRGRDRARTDARNLELAEVSTDRLERR
jgi:repressor LexA